jgi:predicted nucleic acid-binding protein
VLVYFDSVIVIYLIDHTGALHLRATHRLAASMAAGDRIAVTDLTRLECRIIPVRNRDAVKLGEFDTFFARPDVRWGPMTTAVFDRATQIRAAYNFKLGDALHLAAAVEAGCDRFLTNDTRLSRFPDVPVEVLP